MILFGKKKTKKNQKLIDLCKNRRVYETCKGLHRPENVHILALFKSLTFVIKMLNILVWLAPFQGLDLVQGF